MPSMASSKSKVQRKKWTDKNMLSAMEEFQKGGTSLSAIARKYDVPRRTLEDRVKGRVKHGKKPGPSTILSEEEETALVNYLVYTSQVGFPLTPKMVTAFAWAIAIRAGKAHRFPRNGPGKNWFTRFRKRHPELSLRRMDTLERSRAEALSPSVVSEYFDVLERTMSENDLIGKGRQIYNCDETFLPLNETKEKAVTLKSAKTVYSQACGTTEHITMLCAASAAGNALPPMIIYPKAFPGGQYRFGGPDDALYGKSDSGWIDSELFMLWMKRIFLKYAVPERPILLLVDGHKTHLTLELVDLARNNQVILLCLPPHTTHALQPLDVAVFKSLKAHFATALRSVCFTKKDFVVSKRDFARVVKEPFEMAFSMINIKNGFRKCGIFPFNRNAFDSSKMAPSEPFQSSGPSSSPDKPSSSPDIPDAVHGVAQTGNEEESSFEAPLAPESDLDSCSHTAQTSHDQLDISIPSSIVSPPSSIYTPPLFSTPVSSVSLSGSVSSQTSSVMNPLVMAGLIPSNLSDILTTPKIQEKPKRRVFKARVLTEDEYYNSIVEKEKKEKEAAVLKEQRRIERERKKIEKEAAPKKKKIEKLSRKRRNCSARAASSPSDSETEKPERKKSKKTKKTRSTRATPPPSDSETEQPNSSEAAGPSKRKKTRLPALFQRNSGQELSGDESDTVCNHCNQRDPTGCDSPIFWIDCDACEQWYHMFCMYGSNLGKKPTSSVFICDNCS